MIASTQTRVALGDGQHTTLESWGEGGHVLLGVHGISSSRKSWARMAEYYAGSHRVYAYDQRGHGDSAGVTEPMTLERSLLDLEAVVRAIGAPVDVLIGHSWGGAVVLGAGRRVAAGRVLAIDPMLRVHAGAWKPWLAEVIEELAPVFAATGTQRERVVREMFADLAPIEIDAKVHALHAMTPGPIVSLGDENGADAGKWDLRETVRDYPKPLLFALADPSESVVMPDDATFVREHGGPHVRVEVFEGEGHSLQRTAFDRFVALANDFIDVA